MKYQFPKIENIQQVRDAISASGLDEFIEKVDPEYHVFNYVMSSAETFPPVVDETTAILRECRGLTFYPDGTLASRKFHKFFNLNEKPETTFDVIDFSRPHVILQKRDGSMITPFLREDGEIEVHTKMGRTEVAIQVDSFLDKHPEYIEMMKWCIENNLTPIFEWCSRKNRIVIDHPIDELVLLAIRENESGEYLPYE